MTASPKPHPPIAPWFRYCLLLTAIFNVFGAISFAPPVYYSTADSFGLPTNVSPFSLWVIASWILIFGLGYAWLFINRTPENLFIAAAAACKFTIALFFFIFYFTGDLPLISFLVGCCDLLFSVMFIVWLLQTNNKNEH
ncbi:hypothetical protein H6G89_29950 [Oscillatoria sp. FACHB-1407]|uniref:hypothetical protein n=1 Tax=Oscillatoria sp. FACHB-1407 TaxID=2692847 RepID=UPI001684DD65|nr:hypothetical protein [Oscillatoria sp. FACHB-1407]MBD2465237.1 hypothetical protein [Oscillatoria sp. FACHB-1407]